MDPKPGGIVGQKFELERPLARGGMGSVWVGKHLSLDVPVAVKFMSSTMVESQQARARFEREAKAAAQLRSPHVVQILDYGVDGDTPYMVLELLTGEDLRARLDRSAPLSLAETSEIVAQIAKGLALAHDAGIVHRDLKPSNVFLARIGDDEVVKLLDFGVAKETKSRMVDDSTTTGLLLGSPTYMSPEQARGGPIDHRSDLWSLGVVAFHALTGHRPFAGEHLGDVIAKIVSDEIPVATRLAPRLPPAIDAFFARALCRSPDGRFATARAMSDELARIAGKGGGRAVVPAAPSSRPAAPELAARNDETVSQVVVPADTGPSTQARGRGRSWGWIAFPVAAAALWLAWRSRLLPRPGSPGDESPPIVSTPPVSAPPVETAPATPVVTPAAETSAPTSSASAASSAPVASSALPSRSPPFRPRPPARPPDAPGPTVDPKFGLPTEPGKR